VATFSVSVNNKDLKAMRVAESTLSIMARTGVGGLTIARLAKSAGVSRSWIYKYIGKDREALLVYAVGHFGRMFADLKSVDAHRSPEQWVADLGAGFERLLKHAEAYPSVIRIFFQAHGSGGALGRCMDELLERHGDRERLELMHVFKLSESDARAISETLGAIRLGLADAWVHGSHFRQNVGLVGVSAMFRSMASSLLPKS
jgi:AcrR family transcriptional regulator